MDDRPIILEYGQKPRRLRRGFWLGIGLVIDWLLIWGLFELQRMPYRPPQDMSTLLGSDEIAVVRFLMLFLAMCSVVAMVAFVAFRSKSSS